MLSRVVPVADRYYVAGIAGTALIVAALGLLYIPQHVLDFHARPAATAAGRAAAGLLSQRIPGLVRSALKPWPPTPSRPVCLCACICAGPAVRATARAGLPRQARSRTCSCWAPELVHPWPGEVSPPTSDAQLIAIARTAYPQVQWQHVR